MFAKSAYVSCIHMIKLGTVYPGSPRGILCTHADFQVDTVGPRRQLDRQLVGAKGKLPLSLLTINIMDHKSLPLPIQIPLFV